jgi:chromosome segregation ATPase
MEAATTLPFSRVRTFNGELLVDGLRVDDPTAVRLVREREERGEIPDQLVRQMIEVGARVLDREDTGAEAEVVRAEFERLKADFGERLNKVFGADEGHVARLLDKHFGEESSSAVQHRMRAVMTELAAQMREDLRRQFTADSEQNPIVAIQRASLQVVRDTASQQAESLRAMHEQVAGMRLELAALRAEKEKLEEVAAEAERGTAKGRTYEEAVFDALDAVAGAQGDDCDAVGDVKGVGGKKGDVVVAIDACAGPARGRIVFEAKNSKLSKKQALADLDEAMATRDADYGIFVVPSEDKLPARTPDLREFNGNKLFVVFDPDDGSRRDLEIAYKLARARVLMARSEGAGVDTAAVASEVERALGAMEDVRRVKSQLTQATTYIGEATKIVDAMAGNVRGHLGQIESLLRDAEEGEAP